MPPQLQTPTKKVMNMSQVMKLQDVASKFSDLVESFRQKKDECIVQDEQDRPVAVVLPFERYENYQAYLNQRERDFAIFDEIDEKMKGYDPDFIEAQIEKAVEEVKVKYNAERQKA